MRVMILIDKEYMYFMSKIIYSDSRQFGFTFKSVLCNFNLDDLDQSLKACCNVFWNNIFTSIISLDQLLWIIILV